MQNVEASFRSSEKEDIYHWARKFGQVDSVELSIKNFKIAFVNFVSDASVEEAIKEDGRRPTRINGNRVRISRAIPHQNDGKRF
jgi:RNA recognition motif-containing protein